MSAEFSERMLFLEGPEGRRERGNGGGEKSIWKKERKRTGYCNCRKRKRQRPIYIGACIPYMYKCILSEFMHHHLIFLHYLHILYATTHVMLSANFIL